MGRLKKITVFSSLILIISSFLLICAGCGDKESGEDRTKISGTDPTNAPELNTFQKIDLDLQEGKLTKQDAVKLTFIAAYSDDALPKRYKTEQTARKIPATDSAIMEAEWWLHKNWDTLSDDEKESLMPFYVTPEDPRSFFHPANQGEKAGILKKLEIIPSVDAASDWTAGDAIISETPMRYVIIKYNTDDTGISQRVRWVNESIFTSWPKIESLLEKRPDKSVILYLVPMSGGTLGSAVMETYEDSAKRCTVKIKKDMDEKETKATVTHELFHCFQFYIPIEYEQDSKRWMMEATAKWSEHYVWPEYNTEWDVLDDFFATLDTHMITWNRAHEYRTYMWYLYLTQKLNDPKKVKDDLYAIKNKDAHDVVAATQGFPQLFADYMMWNWNQDPKEMYRDVPRFPTAMSEQGAMYPTGDAFDSNSFETKTKKQRQISANTLAGAYNMDTFGSAVEKVVYTFTETGDELHQRHALIKIGDTWHEEDWTDLTERKFCRTRAEEKVNTVVLILSNADKSELGTYVLNYETDTTGECAPQWHGYTKWSWQKTRSADMGVAQQTYEQTALMEAHDTLIYYEEDNSFLVKDQSITYSFFEQQDTRYPDPCGMQSHTITNDNKGTAAYTWEIDENDLYNAEAPTRLSGNDDGTYTVNMDVNPPTDWITATFTRHKTYKDCGFEGAFTPRENKPDETETDVSNTRLSSSGPNDIDIEMTANMKAIKGTAVQKWGSGGDAYDINIEVNYEYS